MKTTLKTRIITHTIQQLAAIQAKSIFEATTNKNETKWKHEETRRNTQLDELTTL